MTNNKQDIKMSYLGFFKDHVDDYYKRNFRPYGKFRAVLQIPVGQKNQNKLLKHIEEEYGMVPIHYGYFNWVIEKKK